MNEKKKLSGIKKICIVMAAILAINGGLVTAYAASNNITDGYYNLNNGEGAEGTDVNGQGLQDTDFVVINESVEEDDSDIIEIDITDEVMKGRATSFSVTLPYQTRKTVKLYMVKGDKLTINAVIVPSTVTIRAGIIRPNGTKSYVYGKSAISGTFAAAVSDYHYLYVENPNSSGKATVAVSYSIK